MDMISLYIYIEKASTSSSGRMGVSPVFPSKRYLAFGG